jgi:hypothetical protein
MVRRVFLLAAASVACMAALISPPPAGASNSSATEAYLRANYQLVKVAHANLPASVAGYRSVLAKVRTSCPKAALKSPQDPESTELSNEVIGTMVLTAGKPDLGAIKSYLAAVRGLRWSSPSITRAVSSYVSMLGKLYRLSIPDLCGDVAHWASSNYTALPSTTVAFERVFYPNWVALGLIPAGLRAYENATSRELAKRSAAFEFVLTDAEAEAVETWGFIMNALELNP